MPPAFHRHLRTGLDYASIDTTPEDLLESLPDEQYDPQARAAKRQRIEAIAAAVIKGTKPIILSASLRGPFEKWETPWGSKGAGKGTNTLKVNNAGIVSRARKVGRRHARTDPEGGFPGTTVTARSDYRPRTAKSNKVNTVQEPPPLYEGRSGELRQADEHQGDSITDSTAGQHSAATEYFSVPDQGAQHDDSPSSRHPRPERYTKVANPMGTPVHQPDTRGEDQHDAPPSLEWTRTRAMNPEWRSSASESMLISSPVKSVPIDSSNPTRHEQLEASLHSHDPPILSHLTIDNTNTPGYQSVARRSTRSSARKLKISSPKVVQLGEATTSVVEGYQSARRLVQNAITRASQTSQRETPIVKQLSEAICAHETPTPLIQKTKVRISGRRTSKEAGEQRLISHDLVASPALGSSIGFAYRKMEKVKAKEKVKPRPVTFSSSPRSAKDRHRTLAKAQPDHVIVEGEEENTANQGVSEEAQIPRLDVYDIMGSVIAAPKTHFISDGYESQRSSRLSLNYSTQAALMLAQMEFQEGTFPPASTDIPHSQDDIRHSNRREPSPAVTPFHTFNAELDKRHPISPESAFGGPPLSTQDLFAAASPFAFSTMKKKSTRPQRSTLRFSVLSNERDEQADGARSPTPSAERVPLKDRNYKVSFRNTPVHGSQTSFNGSQTEKASQDSMLQTPKPSRIDVELPLLDFHTSLDNLGPNGDLEFTDRFLRNLDGIT